MEKNYTPSDLAAMGYDPATAAKLAGGKFLALPRVSADGVSDPAVRAVHEEYSITGLLRGRNLVRAVSAQVEVSGLRVLDFGCGDGGASAAFAEAGAEVTGLEYGAERQQWLEALAEDMGVKLRFVADQNYGACLPSESFDLIVCNDVIEHVGDAAGMAAAHCRLLRPDGLLYLVAPSRYSLRNIWADPHYRLFGISLMGRRLGAAYVVRVRRAVKRYTVDHLYGFREIVEVYAAAGIKLTCVSDEEIRARLRGRKFGAGWKRALAGLAPESLALWVHRHFIAPTWPLVGRKT